MLILIMTGLNLYPIVIPYKHINVIWFIHNYLLYNGIECNE